MTEISVSAGSIEKRVALFIAIRNKLKELNDAHEKAIESLVNRQKELQGELLQALAQAGASSIKTDCGTAISNTRYTASLNDGEMFMRFVQEHNAFDLLDRRANATAVKEYVKKHGVLPPGVSLSAIETLGVRSPREKAD